MDDFTRVRESVDLVDVVSRNGVELKRAGARMVGCCPFHAEKSPSFGIPIGQSFFKCFGCGKGGDVFTFLSEHLRISRGEALRQLAEERGITLSRDLSGEGVAREARDRALKVLAEAQELFRRALVSPLGNEARELLVRRKLTPAIIEAFGLGFAPANPNDRFHSTVITDRLVKAGHRREDIVAAGIGVSITEGGGADGEAAPTIDAPLVRDRVTFPIRDERGRIIAFGSRRLRDLPDSREAKYINSRETLLFSKSRVLYGLDRARPQILKEGQVVLVEGYMDVILAHQGGLTSAIAALGTAVTPEHAKALGRMAPKAVLFLDSDEAGQRAAERAVPILLAEKIDVRVFVLREDKDPGDFFARGATREGFDGLLQREGVAAIEFLIARAGGKAARGGGGIDERIAVARKVGAAFADVRDPLVRTALIEHLARTLDLPAENLDAAIAVGGGRRAPWSEVDRRQGVGAGAGDSPPVPASLDRKVPPAVTAGVLLPMAQVLAEEDVLTALLRQPTLRAAARQHDCPLEFGDPRRARLFHCLVEESVTDPGALVEVLLGKLVAEPEAQQTLADLLSRPVSADPGELFDGAWRWFGERRRKLRADELLERFKSAIGAGDPNAATEFLRQYDQVRKGSGTR
ncbi:MAG: DNA primase [Planctomycetes bacterium]|nr:DNA primase [Planctomycetota bacterium]